MNEETDKHLWRIAELLAQPEALFTLWVIQTGLCRQLDDFRKHFEYEASLEGIIETLQMQGYIALQRDQFALTPLGMDVVEHFTLPVETLRQIFLQEAVAAYQQALASDTREIDEARQSALQVRLDEVLAELAQIEHEEHSSQASRSTQIAEANVTQSLQQGNIRRTLQEYQRRWLDAMLPESTLAPWDEELSSTSCVIFESARSIAMGEWCSFFPDFGDAVCFYRYLRIPEELEIVPAPVSDKETYQPPATAMGESNWSRYRSRFSNEEVRRRRYTGVRALDALLTRFVQEGYQPDMSAKLLGVVNATLIDCELHDVFVLPGDLNKLLTSHGNPLNEYDSFSKKDVDETGSPAFDLNDSEQRAALAESLEPRVLIRFGR